MDWQSEFKQLQQVGWLYGTMLAVVLLATAWKHYTGDRSMGADMFFAVLLCGVIGSFAWPWREHVSSLWCWPSGPRWPLLVIPLAPMFTLASVRWQSLLAGWLGWPVHRYLDDYPADGFGLCCALLMIAVLPAISEEIAFRGLVLGKCRRLMPDTQAVMVSSLLFAILHFNVVGMLVFLVPLAAAAAWVTIRTRSLWPAIVIHFLHNAGVLFLEYFDS